MRIAVALRHANAFHAAGDGRVRIFVHDLMRGHRDGLQAGRTESIHGGCRHRHRQPSQNGRNTRDIRSLHAVRLCASQNHIADFRRIERRRFTQNILDAMRRQIFRTRHVERAAKRFCQRGAGTGYHHCFSHECSFPRRSHKCERGTHECVRYDATFLSKSANVRPSSVFRQLFQQRRGSPIDSMTRS